jgi:hypothetical protein
VRLLQRDATAVGGDSIEQLDVDAHGAILGVLGTVLGLPAPFNWRPHGDSNPGTHRERVMS